MGANKGGFTVKRVTLTANGYAYFTFRVAGKLNGQRIRRDFKSKAEANGERDRLAIQAANTEGDIRAVNTRLTPSQVTHAEAAFARLGEHSLPLAVEWFLANYRPPTTEKLLADAVVEFQTEKASEVSAPVLSDYKKLLKALQTAIPKRLAHTITTPDPEAFLGARGKAKKTWNNGRTYLHSFFEYCRDDRRRWVTVNPAKALKQHTIARGIPHTETAAKLAELFAFLEAYSGPAKAKNKPGYLVPYFALATFAGIRPSVRDGELFKIHGLSDRSRIIDLALGVIRITALFAPDCRPSLRWLKPHVARKIIPYFRIGRFVRFDPVKVRQALEASFLVQSKHAKATVTGGIL